MRVVLGWVWAACVTCPGRVRWRECVERWSRSEWRHARKAAVSSGQCGLGRRERAVTRQKEAAGFEERAILHSPQPMDDRL